nr:aminotransferase class I/II-fold pyridoxal phosphate-dependent enzyme [Bacilli bacterium]
MIDLRSDTVTKPTPAMRAAMANAEVGDDVYGEDVTMRKLEETAAQLFHKEAAIFVTSGTQGNQVAVLTHMKRGEEVIVEADSHVFYYELGAMSSLAGVQVRQVPGVRGQMAPHDVEKAIRKENIHFPRTSLICLENTHNRAGGAVLPLSHMQAIADLAKAHHLPVHLDGARIFNASVAAGVSLGAYGDTVDTLQVCLSKGLAAPVGSLLVGPKAFIEEAKRWRKAFGGGLRQSGVLAAPGLIALTEMVDRLADDHRRAKELANAFANMAGLRVDLSTVMTNIVIIDINELTCTSDAFLQELLTNGVIASDFDDGKIRFVTHLGIEDEDITRTIDIVANVVKQHTVHA